MLQHANARPHVARICTQFLEAENIPVLAWPALTGHVTHWACLGCSGSAYTTACSSSCQYPATDTWCLFHKTSLPNKPDLFHLVWLIVNWFDSNWFWNKLGLFGKRVLWNLQLFFQWPSDYVKTKTAEPTTGNVIMLNGVQKLHKKSRIQNNLN